MPSLSARSFRTQFRFAALAVGLAVAGGATLASAAVELQGEQLSFDAQLDSSSAARVFYVEVSSDLENWESYQVFRYSGEDEWQIDESPDGIEIASQTETGEGVWEIEFAVAAEDAVFARVLSQTVEGPLPADPTVAAETRALLRNLHRVGWDTDGFMMGHELPLSFSLDGSGDNDPNQSDIKDVVGDHPGIHGSDFHFLIDKDPVEIARHTVAARKAFEDGAVVTFDHHWPGKYGGSHEDHPEDDKILDYVVRNDDSRGDVTWFYARLDTILEIVNEDLRFPIVFRPFHEMDGDWFWWGRQLQGGTATYRAAYQLLVEYMSARTKWVLFCWSPDVSQINFEPYYPGDAYVDVIGRDIYRAQGGRSNAVMIARLEQTVDFAEARGKVAAFTETGYNAGSPYYEVPAPTFWTASVLDPIMASPKASRIAWVLTWVNTSWSGPYVPHDASPQAAKDDFIDFYESPATLFQAEVAALKMYE